MTKDKAYDMLSERIRDMCIPDLIYGNSTVTEKAEIMIAILSDIYATEQLLTEIVEKSGEQDDTKRTD